MKGITNILFFVAVFLIAIANTYACPRVLVHKGSDYVKVFSHKNTIFVIKDDINLDGKRVLIGDGCTMKFQGGSISNGTVVGNNTKVSAGNYEIFKRGYTRYRAYIDKDAKQGYPPNLKKEYHNCVVLEGTWSNRKCGSNWTGLQRNINEDVMLSVKNYVVLHAAGSYVKLPTIAALGYEQTKFPGNRIIDFNNSSIDYPDTLSIWEDKTIILPDGAIPCQLESGYGLITLNDNITVANLFIDAKSNLRSDEQKRLGVSNIICIGNSHNIRLENISILNVLGPAMVAHPKSKDITFYKCIFKNIGEHVLYSQQYLGYCRFEKCLFESWDSERLSVFRNGLNYIYKHTPPVDNGEATYDEFYSFELLFTDCVFRNPKRVNAQGRTLGGFLTGSFPILVKIENCLFEGEPPVLNPGGGSSISEKSGKNFRMIISNCKGAPVVYPSKSNFNIITEFYNCKDIPFRTVYAKRYEKCELYIDLYEDNIENVSSSFEDEFGDSLIISNCVFKDRGNKVKINHPIFHRPVVFENCEFNSDVERKEVSDIVTVKKENLNSLSFIDCRVRMPRYRLVGGNMHVNHLSISQCLFYSIEPKMYTINSKDIVLKANVY